MKRMILTSIIIFSVLFAFNVFAAATNNANTNSIYGVTIDYGKSLDEMIRAGKYNWSDPDINEKHFPVKGEGKHKRSIVLFHFGQDMESEEIIDKMDKQGYRPATIEELLALGEKYPDIPREFPIVALGSVWRGRDDLRGVSGLYRYGSGRYLYLDWFDYGWIADYRFAAVRK